MCITNIYLIILILLTILLSANSTSLKDNDEIYIIQVEYGYNITNFKFEVLNRDDAEINDGLSSRIAFMNSSDYDNNIFDLYSVYINKYWIFLVNSSEVADKLLQREDYKKKELYINGIIVPESLNYKMPDTNNNKKIPVFVVKDNITETLFSFDIRSMNKHTYFLFEIKRAIANYPEIYLFIVSLALIIGGFFMTVFWKIKLKSMSRRNVLLIHSFLFAVPLLLFILSIPLVIKAVNIRGKDPNKSYDDSIFVDTALITLSAIYKSLLWFMTLLICYGWNIIIFSLSREDLKFLMKMFFFIYVAMCLDQIIDSSGIKVWIFHISELKNIFFYTGMLIYLIRKINKNLLFLERRIYYARLLNLDYIDTLLYKIKLTKRLEPMLYSYMTLFIIVLLIHKIAIYDYDTPLLASYDYLLVDVYLTVYLMCVLYPRILPDGFRIDLGNNLDQDIGTVYKAFLPKYNEINKENKDNKKQIQSMKDKTIPILILGPCLSHFDNGDGEEISINNYINNIEIGFAD